MVLYNVENISKKPKKDKKWKIWFGQKGPKIWPEGYGFLGKTSPNGSYEKEFLVLLCHPCKSHQTSILKQIYFRHSFTSALLSTTYAFTKKNANFKSNSVPSARWKQFTKKRKNPQNQSILNHYGRCFLPWDSNIFTRKTLKNICQSLLIFSEAVSVTQETWSSRWTTTQLHLTWS